MKPSGKYEAYNGKTPEHDEIHLFLWGHVNEVLEYCNVKENKIKGVTTKPYLEEPIWGYNRWFYGSADGFIDISFNGMIYQRVVYEIKPRFNSKSQAISQVKAYRDFKEYIQYKVDEYRDYKEYHNLECNMQKPIMLLVTFDLNKRYDDLFEEQGIKIMHLVKSFGEITIQHTPKISLLEDLFWSK